MLAPADPAVIDLLSITWWQGVIGLVGVLGLSPAPWLLGLATGRIQFSAPAQKSFDGRVEELKEANRIALAAATAAHTSAIAELVKHHEELDKVKDAAHAETKESRDYYRAARIEEAKRADMATDQLADVVEVVKVNMKMLNAIDEAAKDAGTQ